MLRFIIIVCEPTDTFAVPGGKVDFGETFLATAARELYEETGIDIRNSVPKDARTVPCFPPLPSSILPPYIEDSSRPIVPIFEGGSVCAISPSENLHMIVRVIVCDMPFDSEPQNLEPLKCAGWFWVPWAEIQALAKCQYQRTLEAVANMQTREQSPDILDIHVDMSDYKSSIPELNGARLFPPLLLVGNSSWSPFASTIDSTPQVTLDRV